VAVGSPPSWRFAGQHCQAPQRRNSAWSGRVDQQGCEPLHPPEDRDVIGGDATLSQQFLDFS
jgi:hypothetical protein